MPTILLREKDLPTAALRELAARIQPAAVANGGILLISDQPDVARAANAHGVHLGGRSIPWSQGRHAIGESLLLGCSCHSAAELALAESAGADYAFLSPFAAPLSKQSDLPPLGPEGFKVLASASRLPVVALGGLTAENATDALAAGAAGIAAITLFMTGDLREIEALVAT